MASPWVHAIVHLRGWWLPGDARGFRNREHRIHSSGDYKAPPPSWEHAHLRTWMKARSTKTRPLSREERLVVLATFVEQLQA